LVPAWTTLPPNHLWDARPWARAALTAKTDKIHQAPAVFVSEGIGSQLSPASLLL
jgi:hypothetical protein